MNAAGRQEQGERLYPTPRERERKAAKEDPPRLLLLLLLNGREARLAAWLTERLTSILHEHQPRRRRQRATLIQSTFDLGVGGSKKKERVNQ